MHFVSYMFDLKVNITYVYVCVLNIHMNLVCSGQGHKFNHHDNTQKWKHTFQMVMMMNFVNRLRFWGLDNLEID